jgi:hypothetical protein
MFTFSRNELIKKKLLGATVRSYIKSIKLFCEMAELDRIKEAVIYLKPHQ